MKKFTKRDMFTMLTEIEEVKANEDLLSFIEKEIEMLDKKALKAKERATTKTTEGDELRDTVFDILGSETFTSIADITAFIGKPEITPAKVTSRLTALVKMELVEKQEITVMAGETKRKVQGYRIISQ